MINALDSRATHCSSAVSHTKPGHFAELANLLPRRRLSSRFVLSTFYFFSLFHKKAAVVFVGDVKNSFPPWPCSRIDGQLRVLPKAYMQHTT